MDHEAMFAARMKQFHDIATEALKTQGLELTPENYIDEYNAVIDVVRKKLDPNSLLCKVTVVIVQHEIDSMQTLLVTP